MKIRRGFTIMEVLIASTVFVLIATMSTTILVRTIQAEKRTDILNAMYDDARVVMEQITNVIHSGTIDYDEYYSINVVQPTYGIDENDQAYGLYHGVYGSRFFHPGNTYPPDGSGPISGTNPENLGRECAISGPDGCEVYYTDTYDENTAQNPYEGNGGLEAEDSNAFCDKTFGDPGCRDMTFAETDELYIIGENSAGTFKAIIARQLILDNPDPERDDYAVGQLTLFGIDTDGNNNPDIFTCIDSYNCELDYSDDADKDEINQYFKDLYQENGIPPIDYFSEALRLGYQDHLAMAKRATLNEEYAFYKEMNFVPVTPFRTSVKNLKFIITPIDDPYRAEGEEAMQVHPRVTIIMTVEPSLAERQRYPGGNPGEVTIQRTVSAGAYSPIESYEPTIGVYWICQVLGECP